MPTPSMNLVLPVPTQTIGPQWATELNAALNLVDDHDHTSGKGKQLTQSSLSIDGDFNLASFNLNNVLGVRFVNRQSAVAATGQNVGMVYERQGELYFNDRDGNEVRITLNGSVDVSATGAITNLTAPASAEYVVATTRFVFSSDTNIRADGAFGRVLVSDGATASPNSIGLKAPASAGVTPYDITLPPTVPPAARLLQVNSLGVMSYKTDNEVGQAMTSVGANAIASSITSITSTGANAIASSISSPGANSIASSMSNGALTGEKTVQASTSVRGTVQLNNSISSTSTTTAATASAVRQVNIRIAGDTSYTSAGTTAYNASYARSATQNQVNLPLGSIIFVTSNFSGINRNQAFVARLHSTDTRRYAGPSNPGTALSGRWVSRGSSGDSDMIAQRDNISA